MKAMRGIPAAALLALAGCTNGQVGQLPPVTQIPPSAMKLQLAMGTATLADVNGNARTGLNLVATFRAPGGGAATAANTPTLFGPPGFHAGKPISGLTPTQVASYSAPGALRPGQPGFVNPFLAGFGSLLGVYGYGLAPANIVDQASNVYVYGPNGIGSQLTAGATFGCIIPPGNNLPIDPYASSTTYTFGALRYDEEALPLNAATTTGGCIIDPPAPRSIVQRFQYYGGPPAWPSPLGSNQPSGFPGFPAGFTDFDLPPVSGKYTLQVQYQSGSNPATYTTLSAGASLPPSAASAPLPKVQAPTVIVHADGSATVSAFVPARVTEAIVFLNGTFCASGPANGIPYPAVNLSLLTHSQGAVTFEISNNLIPANTGPGSATTFCPPSMAHGLTITSTMVGFDYPAFEASYPQNTFLAPAIANSNGTADITTANPVTITY